MATYRCLICEIELTDEQIQGKNECPSCDSKLSYLDKAKDLSIPINWEELRLLCRWAESHSENIPSESPEYLVFTAIIMRLTQYQPEGSAGLTKVDDEMKVHAKDIIGALLSWGLVGKDGRTVHRIPPSRYYNGRK